MTQAIPCLGSKVNAISRQYANRDEYGGTLPRAFGVTGVGRGRLFGHGSISGPRKGMLCPCPCFFSKRRRGKHGGRRPFSLSAQGPPTGRQPVGAGKQSPRGRFRSRTGRGVSAQADVVALAGAFFTKHTFDGLSSSTSPEAWSSQRHKGISSRFGHFARLGACWGTKKAWRVS